MHLVTAKFIGLCWPRQVNIFYKMYWNFMSTQNFDQTFM